MIKLGKEEAFFVLLNGQADVAVKCAEAFRAMVQNPVDLNDQASILNDIEHEGDGLTHQLQHKIATTFITPLDQEDLSELSHALDDITDFIEAVGARLALYRLTDVRPDLLPMADLLVEIAKATAQAVAEFRHGFNRSKTLKDTLHNMHALENQSDKSFRKALAKLFDEPGVDPLYVMKWKEVYDRVENAVDRCEDVAKIIDNIVVKYA
jgi:predicted phosphate transport protein (TIGR00153 family)